jgi:hypothetical protein
MTALADATAETAIMDHLKDMQSTYKVAWPNVPFTPKVGESYYRTAFLSVPSERLTHGNADRHTGIFQVDAVVPAKKGVIPALTLARAVQVRFDRQSITSNGIKIQIIDPPALGPHRSNADWYIIPVSITFKIIA